MTSSDRQTAQVLLLAGMFEKLRTHDGLTADRLSSDRTGLTAPLTDLAAIHRFADVHELDLPDAAVALVKTCILEDLERKKQLVADVVLGLKALHDTFKKAGVDSQITQSLYSYSVTRRRETLLGHWHHLHQAIDATPSPAPSDRSLRGTTEPAVLRELANQLIRRSVYSVGSQNALMPGAARSTSAGPSGRVIVVGGAVMDATFRTNNLPARETSSEAFDFDLSPGGKGLTQAVATARLGLRTSLIAAISDDRFGDDILHYLEASRVDTSLIKRVPQSRTPFTGIFEMELGDSIAVNWRNVGQVSLTPADMHAREADLVGCDVLLTTFEIPCVTMQQTLTIAHRNPNNRPLTIVTPGQPYVDDRVSSEALGRMDYLVAHPWELGQFAPKGRTPFDPDFVARNLLAFGVETLCLLVNGGCTLYSDPARGVLAVPAVPAIYKESSAARDAFCAALAARLIETDGKFTHEVAHWATAAMSCATADFPLSNSMPSRERINDLIARSPT